MLYCCSGELYDIERPWDLEASSIKIVVHLGIVLHTMSRIGEYLQLYSQSHARGGPMTPENRHSKRLPVPALLVHPSRMMDLH